MHGFNKAELLAALRAEKGIEDTGAKQKGEGIRVIKAKLKEVQKLRDEERAKGATNTRLNILRRKISKLKKQTRRVA